MLAVATKACILLYETPKGERSFRFVKEFYTPLPAKSINFVQQTSTEAIRATSIHHPEGGEKLRKERPVSKLGHDFTQSPRARRISTPGDHTYGSQLSLFVIFEKRAGLIRISDASVSEIELFDDGGGPPSPTSTLTPQSTISPASLSSQISTHGFRRSIDALGFLREGKGSWLPLRTLEIPCPPSANGEPPSFSSAKTVAFMSRGRKTHIVPSPLPTPLVSNPPLRVVRWQSPPRHVVPRLSTDSSKDPKLQVIAFTDQGVEVVEMGINFLFRPPDLGPSIGKGKGRMPSISTSEPLTRGSWESSDVAGFLAKGGFWHTLDTSTGRPELRQPVADSDSSVYTAPGNMTEAGKGIYAWAQKGLEDYRVVWLGDTFSGD